ncbi:hypothetical protein K461DRAFT_291419 [Myriangium duriaei CBS 260.36]|uniref:Enoyl reductase (ER) domain-containing protein n=1 Tax=Myriangium duriaei CBS 260.36 TaxID=1168546 RepID=A0A9P4JAP5_9PEZI|nr:hypothetical protein K461DRAFT_291419 [Myriangium duriaei CBS 260.36]
MPTMRSRVLTFFIANRCILRDAAGKVLKGARAIMLAELEGPLLANMNNEDMVAVRILFKTVTSVIWVTNGGLLRGKSPKHSIISGVAKLIMTEQPSVRVSSFDLDLDEINFGRSARLVIQHELGFRKDNEGLLDTQLIEHEGVVYSSRYIVDTVENEGFRSQIRPVPEVRKICDNLELSFLQVGRVESFYFKEKSPIAHALTPEGVVLMPTVFNLGKREATILEGLQDLHSVCVGIVKDIGHNVTRFSKGDYVVCLQSGKFDSSIITNEAACELLRQKDKPENFVSSLIPYCSALHALKTLGGAASGHTILIHEMVATSHFAIVNLARLLGSRIIVTFSSLERQALLRKHYPVLESHHSCIVSAELASKLDTITAGHGIDVAIVNAGSSSLPEVWSSLAKNGKLICTGDSEIFPT